MPLPRQLQMNRILVISSENPAALTIRDALAQNCRVESTGDARQALSRHETSAYDLIFADLCLLVALSENGSYAKAAARFRKANPLVEFVVLVSQEQIREAIAALKSGAHAYLTYPLQDADVRMVAISFRETLTKNMELNYLRDRFWKTDWLELIESRNKDMGHFFRDIRAVAPTIATVLLLGETGTGKGLLARLLHVHSNRCDGTFVAVHCGAIPETLLESELFGHEKGAFTGAIRKKIGRFELARNGTIFLDEIGTVASPAQVKLLQVLQDGTYSPVGGEEQLKTNARIIAATNSDLGQLAEEGSFRKDLFYRLNVFPIRIPPLRDRMEDIPHLVEIFLKRLNGRYGKGISEVHPAVLEAFHSRPNQPLRGRSRDHPTPIESPHEPVRHPKG